MNDGCPVKKPELEEEVCKYIFSLQKDYLAVQSIDVISKALSIDPNFHGGEEKRLWWWIYDFFK